MTLQQTGFLTKMDLISYYNTYPKAFAIAVDAIKNQIGWKPGRQTFTPKQVRLIIEHLGEPLSKDELRIK